MISALVLCASLLCLGTVFVAPGRPPRDRPGFHRAVELALGLLGLPAPVRAIVRATYSFPPSAEDRATWKKLSAMSWPTGLLVRRLVLCVGRRGLKSTLDAALAVLELVWGGHERHAAPGSRIYAVIVAPLQSQSREVALVVRSVLDRLAPLGVRHEARDLGGVPEIVVTAPASPCEKVITILTADATAVRGRAVCFAACDEAGFLPHAEVGLQTGEDILNALLPATVQFPDALVVLSSTPGAPVGVFYRHVTKPPKDALVVRAPSFVTNPALDEARLREAIADPDVFAQEVLASRWGYRGSSFIDVPVRACVDPGRCSLGPRPGDFAIALDFAPLGDFTAIGVASSYYASDTVDVRHVVIEHLELHRGSKERPLRVEAVVEIAAALSRKWGRAPVVFDQFMRTEIEAGLSARGVQTEVASMAPQQQTPRWLLLRDLIRSRRLHIPDDAELVSQLSTLSATQLASGALKVEGKKHDDAADVVALLCEAATKLNPTGGDVEVETPVWFFYDQASGTIAGDGRRFFRRNPNGTRVEIPPPCGVPEFERWANDMRRQGISTPAIDRFFAELGERRG
jgi:hypothetical protein